MGQNEQVYLVFFFSDQISSSQSRSCTQMQGEDFIDIHEEWDDQMHASLLQKRNDIVHYSNDGVVSIEVADATADDEDFELLMQEMEQVEYAGGDESTKVLQGLRRGFLLDSKEDKKQNSIIEPKPCSLRAEQPQSSSSTKAFTGTVIERSNDAPVYHDDTSTISEEQHMRKHMSKFKQQRQQVCRS